MCKGKQWSERYITREGGLLEMYVCSITLSKRVKIMSEYGMSVR